MTTNLNSIAASHVESHGRSNPRPALQRKLRPARFAAGLSLTTLGVAIILTFATHMVDVQQIGGSLTLVLVGSGVLSGVICLGGGFGLMTTAASRFDDQEFERLLDAGNITNADGTNDRGSTVS